MGYQIAYKDDLEDDKRALKDLVQWYGWQKSLIICRYLRDLNSYREDSKGIPGAQAVVFKKLNQTDMSLSFSGCQGRPVLALFRRFFGAEFIELWRKSDDSPGIVIAD